MDYLRMKVILQEKTKILVIYGMQVKVVNMHHHRIYYKMLLFVKIQKLMVVIYSLIQMAHSMVLLFLLGKIMTLQGVTNLIKSQIGIGIVDGHLVVIEANNEIILEIMLILHTVVISGVGVCQVLLIIFYQRENPLVTKEMIFFKVYPCFFALLQWCINEYFTPPFSHMPSISTVLPLSSFEI